VLLVGARGMGASRSTFANRIARECDCCEVALALGWIGFERLVGL
jgi:hypothetical protein